MMSFKTFDCHTNFKDGNVFGENNTFGRFSSFGNNNSFGDDNVFDDYTLFGNGNAFGRYTVFGRYAQVGDDTVLGACATIGECFEFGKRLTMEDVKVLALMCMSSVDGSGRQVQVIVHTEGILIRAGCFVGTLDEFCAKAEAENKTRYSRIVRAAAEALAADVFEKGITGGWDEVKETEDVQI